MKKSKKRNNYDNEERFNKKKRSDWIKPGRNNSKIRLNQYLNMSTKDFDSDNYLDEDNEENYR